MSPETKTTPEQPVTAEDPVALILGLNNQASYGGFGLEDGLEPVESSEVIKTNLRSRLIGSVALYGSRIKTAFGNSLEHRLQKSWQTSLEVMDELTATAKKAKGAGKEEDVAQSSDQLSAISERLKAPLTYRAGERLGLVPPVSSHRQDEKEKREKIISDAPIHLSSKKLEDARAAGDWYTYQRELHRLAEQASHNIEFGGVSPKKIEKQAAHIDRKVATVATQGDSKENPPESPDRVMEDKKASSRGLASEWFAKDRILELKEAIDQEVAKRTTEATVLPGHYQVGFNKLQLERQVTEKYLAKFFGTSIEELSEGKKIPFWIQNRIQDMLDKPMSVLQNKRKKSYRSGAAFSPEGIRREAKEREVIADIEEHKKKKAKKTEEAEKRDSRNRAA